MHIILQDGPAAGEPLEIERTPIFLRVTQNGPCFRAIDQETDDPEQTELVYVYLRQGPRGSNTYRLHHIPPAQDGYVMNWWSWRAWVKKQPEFPPQTKRSVQSA